MKTVHEVSELTGVSVRALHHYDAIGLLCPSERTEAGYRLYSDDDLVRLQEILLFRELEFSLSDIREIIDSPDYDQGRALEQQIELLKLKREHIENLIDLAIGIKAMGVRALTFKPFDTSKIDEYAAQAKASWGSSAEWKEYEAKSAGRTREEERILGEGLFELFKPFGSMVAEGVDPTSAEAVAQAKCIQDYISEHFYTCSDEILLSLGRMYGSGGDFTRNINAQAGEGAAEFAALAIEAYVGE